MTDALTLYQFELCPYCHKVRAGLELKGLAYDKVEVNPMNKKELPALPEGAPRKVPVLRHGGETIFDSTEILRFLDTLAPAATPFTPADADRRAKSDAIEQWVDDELTFAMPTVIYGTWGEALKAAQVTARTSNFGLVQNVAVRAGGSLIMHQVAKRILKKHGKTDGHAWMEENLDRIEAWLGEGPFLTGEDLSLGDVAVHGALTCFAEFPGFAAVERRPALSAWYARVAEARRSRRAA